MQLVFERGDDAEVAAAAAQSPEQVRVIVGARGQEPAIGGDDVGGEQVVAGQAVLALQPADAAAEGEAGDAGRRHGAAGGGESEGLGLAVELSPGQARLGVRDPLHRIYPDAFHGRQVDDQSVVADRLSGNVVATAADRDGQTVLDAELECSHHVGHAGAPGDHRRPFVDHAVVDLAGRLVIRVGGADQRSPRKQPANDSKTDCSSRNVIALTPSQSSQSNMVEPALR